MEMDLTENCVVKDELASHLADEKAVEKFVKIFHRLRVSFACFTGIAELFFRRM